MPKIGAFALAWITSFSAMCSHTTMGIARGSLVQAVSLKADRSALLTVCEWTECIQQLGARTLAAVSSTQACGGIPSSSMETLNFIVPASACTNLVQSSRTR